MTTWDEIQTIAKQTGAKYPELVAAQWALESGWGKETSGRNNFFGLKGKGTKHITKEFVNGREITITAEFQDFDTPKQCVQYLVDRWYKDFKNFKGVNNAPNVQSAAQGLVKGGYATDPKYAEKLLKLLDSYSRNRPSTSTTPSTKMIGPKKKPQDFGFKSGDHHVIINDVTETVKAFTFDGKLLWEVPGLARGQGSDFEFKFSRTDTPPGLYKVGTVYRDYDLNPNPKYDRTLMSFGWYSFDLVELENQENKFGRAGIMVHGGGTACGWPMAWNPMQNLYATHGCVRMHNQHLRDKLLPLVKTGTVYVSVYQEG